VEGELTLVHGSPRDPLWEYLSSIPSARASLAAFDTRHCLVGHTHLPAVFRDDAGRVAALRVVDGTRLRLDDRRCILNPGSVGQPRDGDPRACAMLLDTDAGEVEWRRVPYAVADAQTAIRGVALPSPLADRLALGR
jgi:diadenosine tetraphosphatase ApaH/serine/threonine PP2A family protein phosphatase